jgi:hypothetical protein
MSIYATLWKLKFPRFGDYHTRSEWIDVTAQGVPPHIGSPTPGSFLPDAVVTDEGGEAEYMRAVVIITENTKKGTSRSPQEYVDPLLILSGQEYASLSFQELHERICDALRGGRLGVSLEIIDPAGDARIVFDDGTSRSVNRHDR